ncbi:uncharacterized protein LOC125946042 isoform X2 [Dermacentor silvarum]|uniref:uncharacterized protein LOC125946042 isoform X2 n=1 Tax=Dermacentor silvarum TaxID=543639 RepID=UPI0021013E8A|nr:uncharacterized protein LOC125946042 isoform X2 [Dermacentor silvarum]
MFKMAKFRICRCVTCACVLVMCRHSAGIFVLNVFHFVYKTLHAMASKKSCVQVHVCACLDAESLPSTVALSSAVLAQRYPLNGCSTVYMLVTCSRDLLAVATLRIIASNGKEQPAVAALFVHEDSHRAMGGLTCCVPGWYNHTRDKGFGFYVFPKERRLRETWIQRINRWYW